MSRGIARALLLLMLVVLAGAAIIVWQALRAADHVEVSERQAAIALEIARSKVGAPYVWGARGPDSFDSSGIIIHAYRQAIPRLEFRVGEGVFPQYSEDASHRDIHRWNFRPSAIDEMRPGDLVYITDGSGPVTHGMLFIERIDEGTIRVLDASSRLMRVAVQDWPLGESVRGQTIVATGRLQIVPRVDWLRHEPQAP